MLAILQISLIMRLIQYFSKKSLVRLEGAEYSNGRYYRRLYFTNLLLFFLFFRYEASQSNEILDTIFMKIIVIIPLIFTVKVSFDIAYFANNVIKKLSSINCVNYNQLASEVNIGSHSDKEDFGLFDILDAILEDFESRGKLKKIFLFDKDYYFNINFFNKCSDKANEIIKLDTRIDKEFAVSSLRDTLSLPDECLYDFFIVKNEDINLLEFDDGEFFVHNLNNDKIVICTSCGKAGLISSLENYNPNEEWFCSIICVSTEDKCYKIAYQKDFPDDYREPDIVLDSDGNQLMFNENSNYNKKKAELLIDKINPNNDTVLTNDNIFSELEKYMTIKIKIYKNVEETINSMFIKDADTGKEQYKYYDDDGKALSFEVPKDFYEAAIEKMKEKILNHSINNIDDPEEAKNIIIKSHLTRHQIINTVKFGNIESVLYNNHKQEILSISSFGIYFAVNTATTYWRTNDINLSIQSSAIIGINEYGRNSNMPTSLLSKENEAKIETFINKTIDSQLQSEALTKHATKYALKGLAKITQKSVFSNEAVIKVITTSTISLMKMSRGRISKMQCTKNIIKTAGNATGALVGGVIGSALGPVGTFAGGIVGGMVADKLVGKTVDSFIEDDSVQIMKIVNKHLEYLAINFLLSDDEMQELTSIVDTQISSDREFLEDVFENDNKRAIVNYKLKPIVVNIIKNRLTIPYEVLKADNIVETIS
ncbi:hypothetical protein BFL38_01040 [Brachyspira hampsonii]|uniref:Uncharacterized protein n=1 Tax=Brachyspira hampsonii TaxID=1287055 RepID=A0A1E5NAM7_9SPIR|nr:hypothetical protein BFL38_01040 [Brachyspira hampsonii]